MMPQPELSQDHRPDRRLLQWYFMMLGLVVVLVTVGQLIMQTSFRRQAHQAELVNLTSQATMQNQALHQLLLSWQQSPTDADMARLQPELVARLADLRQTWDALMVASGPVDLPLAEVRVTYANFETALDQLQVALDRSDQAGLQAAIDALLAAEPPLHAATLTLLRTYTEALEAQADLTRNVAVVMFLVLVGSLLLIGYFVIRPVAAELRQNHDALLEAVERTSRQAEQLNQLSVLHQDRTSALEKAVEISRGIALHTERDALLAYTVNRVRTDFDFYHVHIYLLDSENQTLEMVEGSGEVGAALKARRHQLDMGQGIVGMVATTNEAFLSNDARNLLNFVPNPLLPETRSELAVPLHKGDQVLGVLDVQSEKRDQFSAHDVSMLQTVANQVAISLDNLHLLEETQTALQEVQRLNRQLTGEAWIGFGRSGQLRGYQFRGAGSRPLQERHYDLSDSVLASLRRKTLVQHQRPANGEGARTELAIPLVLRDQIIGVLDIKRQAERSWQPEELAAVESVADQLARALDNARLAEEQAETITQLQEVDRIKSEFLASMSHELRTPLNSIIGFADILLQGIDGELNDNMQTDISAIYNSGRHLLVLINDILDLSKIEAGRMELVCEDVSIAQVFSEVAASVSSLLQDKPVELVIDADEALPFVWADRVRLNQVVINLVSNAIKFTEKGYVVMRAFVTANQMMEISVEDTGIGIPDDKLDLVFERFRQADSRTNRKYQGTGMGLAIARQLTELHGGQMWVSSVEGAGSTFFFTIPLVEKVLSVVE